MAETTNTTTTTTTKAKPKAKPAARRSNARRTPSRKAPSKSTARRQRTIAKNETRDAAQAQARAARTTAAQGRNVAERAALVYVGATLEARDRVLGLAGEFVNRYGTRAAAEREVNKDIRRFERRGERDVKKARTRLERAVRTRRREAERLLRRNRRTVEHAGQRGRAPDGASAEPGRLPDRRRLDPRRGRRAVQRRHRHADRERREGARDGARLSTDFPRRRGEAANRVSLPASYSAGGIRRPHISPADAAPSPPSTVDPPFWRVVGL